LGAGYCADLADFFVTVPPPGQFRALCSWTSSKRAKAPPFLLTTWRRMAGGPARDVRTCGPAIWRFPGGEVAAGRPLRYRPCSCHPAAEAGGLV